MILYHGTQAVFDAFDPALIGEGAEANSALGLWATLNPHSAFEYGGGRRILVLEIAAPRLAAVCCYDSAIWGGPDFAPADREIAWPRFVAARTALSRAGYDGVWCECPDTDLGQAVCLFDPGRVRILRAIDHPEDRDLFELEADAEAADDSEVDFTRSLEDALSRRAA